MHPKTLPLDSEGRTSIVRLRPGQSFRDDADSGNFYTVITQNFMSVTLFDHKAKTTEQMSNGARVIPVEQTFEIDKLLSLRGGVNNQPRNDTGDTTIMTTSKNTTATQTTKKSAKSENKGTGRYELFGFPVTAVLRAMGKKGYSVADARAAMAGLKVPCADATIQIQVTAGAQGNKRGEPAKLTAENWEKLSKYKGTGAVAAAKTQDKGRAASSAVKTQDKGTAATLTVKSQAKAGAKTQTAARAAKPGAKTQEKASTGIPKATKRGKVSTKGLALPKPSDK